MEAFWTEVVTALGSFNRVRGLVYVHAFVNGRNSITLTLLYSLNRLISGLRSFIIRLVNVVLAPLFVIA